MSLIAPFLPLVEGHGLTLALAGGVAAVPLAGALWYHGGAKATGVVTAFIVLRAALSGLPVPPREAVSIRSGHPGSGMEDGFEALVRALSGHRYAREEFAEGLRIPGAEGVFRWVVRVGPVVRDLTLRGGVLPEVLFQPATESDEPARQALRLAYVRNVLAAADTALFHITEETSR
ncbi:MAG: hypothetical protein EAZ99_15015 [Alphaproteobacteria bacterium]|nr:MAG: hypothetical protein EAZ99_15015 [Alphaproteobacteria bacterium]